MVAVSGLAILAGCGNHPPGYTSLPGKLGMAWPAERQMREARATTPAGNAYQNALYSALMRHAEFEFGQMQDYRSSNIHSAKAMAAARGQNVEPEVLANWRLPADSIDELTSARSRLVAALAANATQTNPTVAAQALADFDCWVEQQEENFQPLDIARCRDGFYAALEEIEPRAAAVPEVLALEADVFFDFDRADIKPAFFPELDRIARMLVENTAVRVLVWGHTDTVGPAAYNQGLSERRANAVADYLAGRGVSRDRMEVRGFGETMLAVPTPDETNEPRNRRVEIRQR
jgi:OOP family OmpA-OmpF porin